MKKHTLESVSWTNAITSEWSTQLAASIDNIIISNLRDKPTEVGYGQVDLTASNKSYHWVIPAHSNWSLTKELQREWKHWCIDHVNLTEFLIIDTKFCFVNEADATAFLLKFG